MADAATPETPAPEVPKPTTPPPTIALSIEDYQRFKNLEVQMAQFRADQDKALQDKENARLKAVADKDGAEKALSEQRSSWEAKLSEQGKAIAEYETAINDERRDAVLAASLAGRTFSGSNVDDQRATTQDFFDLVKPRFETVKSPSGVREVREKGTGRLASEVLKELLDSPRYAHFFAPANPGKGAGTNAVRPAPTEEVNPNSIEGIAARFKENQGKYLSFGLNRVR